MPTVNIAGSIKATEMRKIWSRPSIPDNFLLLKVFVVLFCYSVMIFHSLLGEINVSVPGAP